MGINPRNLVYNPSPSVANSALKFVFAMGVVGWLMSHSNRNMSTHATTYRDKSAMFGSPKKEGEPPSWGRETNIFEWKGE